MASSFRTRVGDALSSTRKEANKLAADNQPLLIEIRKTINSMQAIAVELEKLNRTEKVKELEDAVTELVNTSKQCEGFSNMMEEIGENFQPGPELTDFGKLFEKEKSKGSSAADVQNDPSLRRFREGVWNVHHAGEPMPGDEQEDIVMTTTQVGLKNIVCPITGKSVTDLLEPVRSKDCKHVYEKNAIMHHIRHNTKSNQCPVAGCPKKLMAGRLVCDPMLLVEIDEVLTQNKDTDMAGDFEDFTALDDED